MNIFETFLANGIHLTLEKSVLLEEYATLLKHHNQRVNLVSRKDIDNILTNHILPCYIFSNRLERLFNVLDIGTGGGLPGIVFAINHQKSKILLIDYTKKKIQAVNEIVQTLGLTNVETFWTRVEDKSFLEGFSKSFDLVISRATADLKTLIFYSLPLFKNLNTSKLAVMKGGSLKDEVTQAKKKYPNLHFLISPLIYLPGNENNENQKYIVTVENFNDRI
jgi:16S rRNA (guanine527-N7)-methyltransferase